MQLSRGLLSVGLILASCSRPTQSKEAVQQGVMEYLQNRAGLDVKNMDVSVSSVSFRQNEAEASVAFHAKGVTDPASSMNMRYVLEQKGGKWVVKGRAGGSEHGGELEPGAAIPPGHAPAGALPGVGSSLPTDHPPIQSGSSSPGAKK